MDPKKIAAMKAAMQNIKEGLQGMNDEDILSKLEKKQLGKKADAGVSEADAMDLIDGMDAGSDGSVEVEMGEPQIISRKKSDGGVEVEIKKPIELSRKSDGGVEVEAGEVRIEKRVSPAQKSLDDMKKGVDRLIEKAKPDVKKLKEGMENIKNLGKGKPDGGTPDKDAMKEQIPGLQDSLLNKKDLSGAAKFIRDAGVKATAKKMLVNGENAQEQTQNDAMRALVDEIRRMSLEAKHTNKSQDEVAEEMRKKIKAVLGGE